MNCVGTARAAGATNVDSQQVAASLRRIRPPDVYKGKGVRYKGEVVRKLPGKTVAATGTGGA